MSVNVARGYVGLYVKLLIKIHRNYTTIKIDSFNSLLPSSCKEIQDKTRFDPRSYERED